MPTCKPLNDPAPGRAVSSSDPRNSLLCDLRERAELTTVSSAEPSLHKWAIFNEEMASGRCAATRAALLFDPEGSSDQRKGVNRYCNSHSQERLKQL